MKTKERMSQAIVVNIINCYILNFLAAETKLAVLIVTNLNLNKYIFKKRMKNESWRNNCLHGWKFFNFCVS